MHFTTPLLSALLSATTLAAPTTTAAKLPRSISLLSIRSGSPVHLFPLSAANGTFYLNTPTSSYCPLDDPTLCPAGTDTAFHPGRHMLSLDVMVPGGQQVYVNADGTFGFTAPHSASMPEGAVVKGFTYKKGKKGGVGSLVFEEQAWTACPAGENEDGSVVYKVALESEGGELEEGCYGIEVGAVEYTGGVAAWEYI